MNVDNIREMTERLLERYSDYDNAKAYFKDYTLLNNDLRALPFPPRSSLPKTTPSFP
jgi:hypothetical protein